MMIRSMVRPVVMCAKVRITIPLDDEMAEMPIVSVQTQASGTQGRARPLTLGGKGCGSAPSPGRGRWQKKPKIAADDLARKLKLNPDPGWRQSIT